MGGKNSGRRRKVLAPVEVAAAGGTFEVTVTAERPQTIEQMDIETEVDRAETLRRIRELVTPCFNVPFPEECDIGDGVKALVDDFKTLALLFGMLKVEGVKHNADVYRRLEVIHVYLGGAPEEHKDSLNTLINSIAAKVEARDRTPVQKHDEIQILKARIEGQDNAVIELAKKFNDAEARAKAFEIDCEKWRGMRGDLTDRFDDVTKQRDKYVADAVHNAGLVIAMGGTTARLTRELESASADLQASRSLWQASEVQRIAAETRLKNSEALAAGPVRLDAPPGSLSYAEVVKGKEAALKTMNEMVAARDAAREAEIQAGNQAHDLRKRLDVETEKRKTAETFVDTGAALIAGLEARVAELAMVEPLATAFAVFVANRMDAPADPAQRAIVDRALALLGAE